MTVTLEMALKAPDDALTWMALADATEERGEDPTLYRKVASILARPRPLKANFKGRNLVSYCPELADITVIPAAELPHVGVKGSIVSRDYEFICNSGKWEQGVSAGKTFGCVVHRYTRQKAGVGCLADLYVHPFDLPYLCEVPS